MLRSVFICRLCQVALFLLCTPSIAEIHEGSSNQFDVTLAQLKEIQTLRADFLQEKNLKILAKPFVAKGKLTFSRKNGDLYWEISEPLRAGYLINDKGIKALQSAAEGSEQTVEFPFADNIGRLFAAILTGNMEELNSYFDISYSGSASGWLIQLKPENRQVSKIVEYIDVSGKEYITQITIHETGGDTTDIKFSNVDAETGFGNMQ